ncbi:MAG: response regulator transcription factor [bacterium]|nr:response regulator transcription factor [bacterium]
MSKTIRIAIAEDHDLMRQGLVSLLDSEENISVVFDVENGARLFDELKKKKVDVVLLDLEMPVLNGHQALKILSSRYPEIAVIVVSMHYSDGFISESIASGAKGFLPKNCDIDKVVDAIYAVQEQGYYFDDKISKALLNRIMKSESTNNKFSQDPLTSREHQIVELVCSGKTNKEIANLLCLSVRTIEVHRNTINKKTNTKNIASLVTYAIKNGLYSV